MIFFPFLSVFDPQVKLDENDLSDGEVGESSIPSTPRGMKLAYVFISGINWVVIIKMCGVYRWPLIGELEMPDISTIT